MDYCLQCGTHLHTDETTLVAPKPTASSHTNRSFYFGMALVCLLVFAVIVIADYFVQRKAHQPAELAAPSPINSLSPSPQPMQKPTAIQKPTPAPKVKATATPRKHDVDDLERYLDPPASPSVKP
jgi:hypothetical protein